MTKIKVQDIEKWVATADTVFQTPIVRQVIWPMVKSLLPSLGLTAEQIAGLDARHADMQTRIARARKKR